MTPTPTKSATHSTAPHAGQTRRVSRAEAKRMLVELHSLRPSDARRDALCERLVRMHMPLVNHVARRLAHRTDQMADVLQVGALGLVNAINRFDPSRGIEFSTFAVPTISGEIKRYFRDTGWLLHVPRTAQEMQTRIDNARSELSQVLGHEPSTDEIAELIEEPIDRVAEAMDVARTRHGAALDPFLSPVEGPEHIPTALRVVDDGFEQAENRALLAPALAELPADEREVLMLRFVADRTQVEIAKTVGVSQMQVSRLISRALARLREQLVSDGYVRRGGYVAA